LDELLTKDLDLTQMEILRLATEERMADDGEIAMMLGISKRDVQRARKLPVFQAAYSELIKNDLLKAVPRVSQDFIKRLEATGKEAPAPAMYRLFFELTGHLKSSKAKIPDEEAPPMTGEQFAKADQELTKQIETLAKGKELPFRKAAGQ
jgi:hypothetical protein